MPKKYKLKTKLPPAPSVLEEMIQREFLGFGESGPPSLLLNPFYDVDAEALEKPHEYMLRFMCNPDNFYFTCKYIFNIELAPFQLAILHNLWTYKYPMLIGSRGMSKSFLLGLYALLRAMINQGCKIIVVGAGFRQAKVVFDYCDTIASNAPVFRSLIGNSKPKRGADMYSFNIGESAIIAIPVGDGCVVESTLITTSKTVRSIIESNSSIVREELVWGNGKFNRSDEYYYNGLRPTKKIVTNKGYSIEGTLNHKIKVLSGLDIIWKRFDELSIGDRVLIDRSDRWHTNINEVTEQQAYALGLMIGDGCWIDEYKLGYASADIELVESLMLGTGLKFVPGDKNHYMCYGKYLRQDWLNYWGLDVSYAKDKCLPNKLLSSSKSCVANCISALYDTDGHVRVSTDKGGVGIIIGFTNTSEVLVNQLQYLLLHFGIVSYKTFRDRNEKWNRVYELLISGKNVKLFAEKINFRLTRKRLILEAGIASKKRWVTSEDEVPNVKEIMYDWAKNNRPRRGTGNSKVVPSKILNSNIITRDFLDLFLSVHCSFPKRDKLIELSNLNIYYDTVFSIEDNEATTYDIHVPDIHEYCANGFFSHNSKIRGQRAHYLIADEFAAMSEAIYENVISGFASTNLSPIEQAKYEARIRVLKREGYWSDEMGEQSGFSGNQSIISGTAYYDFNHFAKYWKRYKTFIESRGDVDYITSKIGISSDKLDKDFDYKDYCVMRIPVDVLPRGFMDDKHISRARLTTSSWDYSMEYGAIFALDSNNFYKRSLIESCVTTQPIQLPSGSVSFSAVIRGNPRYDYVFGVDPASESDNFSIALLELHSDHRRVVYCWTTTKQRFKEKQEKGLVNEHDFYGYVARKIRDLMRVFPCFRIALDSQGGGVAVEEALHDKDKLQEGELPIWPVIDDDDPKDTDNKAGLHILYLVNFSIAQWVREANHGMRKDFEDKVLLFPQMDTVSLAEAAVEDEILKRVYDTLEDCVMEIEDLKDELATIVHTQTPGTGRDHWDTPKIKLPGKKEGRLRKDRYTALLMANAVARKIQRHEEEPSYNASGGFVGSIPKQTGKLYDYGPEWFVKAANSLAKNYGTVVNKSPR
jgi:intein/homing endonuclease